MTTPTDITCWTCPACLDYQDSTKQHYKTKECPTVTSRNHVKPATSPLAVPQISDEDSNTNGATNCHKSQCQVAKTLDKMCYLCQKRAKMENDSSDPQEAPSPLSGIPLSPHHENGVNIILTHLCKT